MEFLKYILLAVGCYLLGSVSFSIIMSRMLGGDVRTKGSGNAGATNMARVYGMLPGVLTLVLDALKAVVCIAVGEKLLGGWGFTVAGAACIFGHCFPVYYGFRGGKGVSVGCGIAFMVGPKVFAGVMLVFIVLVLVSRKVSLGSVFASASIWLFAPLFDAGIYAIVLGLIGASLIIVQHRGNIKRLLNGTEPDFKPATKSKK